MSTGQAVVNRTPEFMMKLTHEEEIAKRNSDYAERLQFDLTTDLLRLLTDKRITDNGSSHLPGLHRWQERFVEDELNARIPPRRGSR